MRLRYRALAIAVLVTGGLPFATVGLTAQEFEEEVADEDDFEADPEIADAIGEDWWTFPVQARLRIALP